jgi:hypothetical protein
VAKHTWQFSKRHAVKLDDEYRSVEIGFSGEFDDAVTPPEASYMRAKELVDERMEEAIQELKAESTEIKEGEKQSEPKNETAKLFTRKEKETGKPATAEDVRKALPKELAELLSFESTDKYIVVKPRQYLGSDNFRKIASIVRDQLGGEYVSAGEDSHFRVSREQKTEKTIGFMKEEPSREERGKTGEFDLETTLMRWKWKGRKKPDGTYARGSLSYGWDFANNFSDSVIRVLEKGPQVIRGYRVTLDPLDKEKGTYVVHTRKEK